MNTLMICLGVFVIVGSLCGIVGFVWAICAYNKRETHGI